MTNPKFRQLAKPAFQRRFFGSLRVLTLTILLVGSSGICFAQSRPCDSFLRLSPGDTLFVEGIHSTERVADRESIKIYLDNGDTMAKVSYRDPRRSIDPVVKFGNAKFRLLNEAVARMISDEVVFNQLTAAGHLSTYTIRQQMFAMNYRTKRMLLLVRYLSLLEV